MKTGSCRHSISVGCRHTISCHPLLPHKTVNTGPYRLLQPLDELIVPILGQAYARYPSVALGTQSPHSTSLTNPHVCNIPCTYTRIYPSGPCTPMQQLNTLHRHVTGTYPMISLMAHTGDDID